MNNKTKQGGLGIVSVLTIIFIVLKLLGVIKWSWIWVLSPLWISAVIVVVVFSVILIGGRIKKGKWSRYRCGQRSAADLCHARSYSPLYCSRRLRLPLGIKNALQNFRVLQGILLSNVLGVI